MQLITTSSHQWHSFMKRFTLTSSYNVIMSLPSSPLWLFTERFGHGKHRSLFPRIPDSSLTENKTKNEYLCLWGQAAVHSQDQFHCYCSIHQAQLQHPSGLLHQIFTSRSCYVRDENGMRPCSSCGYTPCIIHLIPWLKERNTPNMAQANGDMHGSGDQTFTSREDFYRLNLPLQCHAIVDWKRVWQK